MSECRAQGILGMCTFLRTPKSCERGLRTNDGSCVVRWQSLCSHIYAVIRRDNVSRRKPANINDKQDIWLFAVQGCEKTLCWVLAVSSEYTCACDRILFIWTVNSTFRKKRKSLYTLEYAGYLWFVTAGRTHSFVVIHPGSCDKCQNGGTFLFQCL